MPIEREEQSELFSEPGKTYCCRMGPVDKWKQGQITYCSKELGHGGSHEYHVRWLKVKARPRPGTHDAGQPARATSSRFIDASRRSGRGGRVPPPER